MYFTILSLTFGIVFQDHRCLVRGKLLTSAQMTVCLCFWSWPQAHRLVDEQVRYRVP